MTPILMQGFTGAPYMHDPENRMSTWLDSLCGTRPGKKGYPSFVKTEKQRYFFRGLLRAGYKWGEAVAIYENEWLDDFELSPSHDEFWEDFCVWAKENGYPLEGEESIDSVVESHEARVESHEARVESHEARVESREASVLRSKGQAKRWQSGIPGELKTRAQRQRYTRLSKRYPTASPSEITGIILRGAPPVRSRPSVESHEARVESHEASVWPMPIHAAPIDLRA